MNSKVEKVVSLFQEQKINEAESIALEVLEIDPNNFDILHILGIISFQKKNYKTSSEFFKRANRVNPENPEVNNNYGIVLRELRMFDKALKIFDKAIKINPNYAEAYNNRGIILVELNKLDLALDSWDKAIKINPNYAEAYNNRASTLIRCRELEDALENCYKAIKINPNFAEAYNNSSFALKELHQLESALVNSEKAIKINPNYPEAYNSRGIILKELNKTNEALESCNNAIKINPNYSEALLNRGNIFKDLKQLADAVKSYEQAININPDLDYLLGTLIFNKNALCNWSFYRKNLENLKNKISNSYKASIPFYILSIYDSLPLQKISAETNVKDKFPNISKINLITKKKLNKKIRVGYYSGDFREHPVSYQLVHVLESHDRSKFEIYGFSFGPKKEDEIKKRISLSFDKFFDVSLKSDKDIAKVSRELEIDISIDLMGLTRQNRFGIFVERCAPIQVNFLGYAGTLGTECIDYIVGDKILIPKESQKYYSEKIVYLPDTYQPNDSTKKISHQIFSREELGLPKEGFVFCCFNNYYKITPNVFEIWMRLLKRIDGSSFWFSKGNLESKKNLIEEAKKRGIDSSRLVFAERMPLPDHLARLKVADLFLDTLPYNAHTTCSEALWAGLPVLTLIGESYASRAAASILNAIDLPELITNTEKEYEDLAVELATNPVRLKEIKDKLQKNRLTKPLFNTELYTKNLEAAFTKMYERYINNIPINNIEIK